MANILITIAVILAVATIVLLFLRRNGDDSDDDEQPVDAPYRPVEKPAPASEPAARTGTPVAPPVAAEPEKAPVSIPEYRPTGRPLILIAEDNPSNYKLVEVILRNDYDLVHAENGEVAIACYDRYRPRIVLMDISMPVMDGYDALRGIRALDPRAYVMALTAYAYEADRQKMLETGFDCCLAKPLDIRKLKEQIRLALSQPNDR